MISLIGSKVRIVALTMSAFLACMTVVPSDAEAQRAWRYKYGMRPQSGDMQMIRLQNQVSRRATSIQTTKGVMKGMNNTKSKMCLECIR
jgi:hypothetical protein